MSPELLDLADRLWRGDVPEGEFHPFRYLGGVTEVHDGVAFLPAFANVAAFDTGDGLVLVDTGSQLVAELIRRDLRRWSSAPVHTAVYSHGHIDHVGGMPVFEQEAADQGWRAPRVVSHEAVPNRFERYLATAGYNQVVNRRQFSMPDFVWPTEYRFPDETYADTLALSVGSMEFALRHEMGETDDHTVTWLAGPRVLCCGDLFIWASPNAGNPQKAQRYPRQWADALRRMAALGAEVLLPGHGLPVVGTQRVAQTLGDTARLLESLVEQTLELMNAGARLSDALHSVRPPADLEGRPYLRPIYDEPEFVVHNIWRLYGGWWDGDPASLKPAPAGALAAELAELSGGASALANRALELLADAGGAPTASAPDGHPAPGDPVPGDSASGPPVHPDLALRLAGHLVELAWLASPDDPAIGRARQAVYTVRAERAGSVMARGVFRWAAEGPPAGPDPSRRDV